MTKSTFGVSNLTEALESKEAKKVISNDDRGVTKSISSPISAPAMSGVNRLQRIYLDLPVSKKKVECELVEIDPDQCVVSKFNKRIQSVLSPADPTIIQLMKSIEEDKQRDPVLIRPLNKPVGNAEFELIYGSRRRFIVKQIQQNGRKEVKLKAWLSREITDTDAKRLADSENDDRQAISSWELAKYYQRLKEENVELTAEVIAVNEGTTASSIWRYLQLSALSEEVVKKVSAPSEISLRSGLEIIRVLNSLKPAKRKEIIQTISSGDVFLTASDLLKFIRHMSTKKPTSSSQTRIEIKNDSGQKKALIGSHRSNRGQYKIDLYDIEDTKIEEIVDVLEKIFTK